MNSEPSFFRLAFRQFWMLFGAVWTLVGVGLLVGGLFAVQEKQEARPWFLVAGGAVFGSVGVVLFLKGLRRVQTIQRLYREGVRAEGTVTSVEQTNVSINKVRQWVVRFSFHDYTGQVREAKSEYMPPEEARDWNVGDVGQVRYDQRDPSVNIWTGREAP